MSDCIHCGLPATPDCAGHVQRVTRRKANKQATRDPLAVQSIHPRVRNGRTVSPKVNTSKPKRAK